MKSMCPCVSVYTHTRLSFFFLFFFSFYIIFFSLSRRPNCFAFTATSPWKRPTPAHNHSQHSIYPFPPLLSPYVVLPPSNVCAIRSTMNDDAGAPIPTDALFVPPSPSKRKKKKKGKIPPPPPSLGYIRIFIIYTLFLGARLLNAGGDAAAGPPSIKAK